MSYSSRLFQDENLWYMHYLICVCVWGGGLSCVHYDVSCFLAYFCYAGPMSSLFGVDLFDFREVV